MKKTRTFREIVDRTREVIDAFHQVEKRSWGIEAEVVELTKQVGDLSKKVMSLEGYYLAGRDSMPEYSSSRDQIADELSDILFMCIRIADRYDIDLEEEHMRQMDIAMDHPHMRIERKETGN